MSDSSLYSAHQCFIPYNIPYECSLDHSDYLTVVVNMVISLNPLLWPHCRKKNHWGHKARDKSRKLYV